MNTNTRTDIADALAHLYRDRPSIAESMSQPNLHHEPTFMSADDMENVFGLWADRY